VIGDSRVWRVVGAPLVTGADEGPLAGLLVAVKDLYAVKGQPIGAGNPTWLGEAPLETAHAAAVARLLEAGAAVAGITQTDELAYGLAGENAHYGTPPNPRAPGRVSGGSTSGSAAAVAAGAADIGLGTDTAGSIRVPASYCGLHGLRTTHDLVSREGLIGLAPSFDAVGLLTRDAATLRQASVTLGLTGLTPIRRLLVVHELVRFADEPVRASFDAATRALAGRRGLPIDSVPILTGGDPEEWLVAFRTLQDAEAWQIHGDWVEAHPGALGPAVQARFDAARTVSPAARSTASAVLARARETVRSAIPPGTALLLPTTSGPAPRRGLDPADMDAVRAATLRLTIIGSLAGLPTVSAPLLDRGPYPVGLSLIGAAGTDLDLIDLVSP
jgi:amidase